MNERQVSEAAALWVGDVINADAASIAAYPPASALGPPPLVAAFVTRKRFAEVRNVRDLFPLAELEQQEWMRVFEVAGSILTALPAETEAGALAATQQLQGWGKDLEVSLFGDDTLGSRVEMASPFMAIDYSQVYQELDDGFRGRIMVIEFVVGELIDFDPA